MSLNSVCTNFPSAASKRGADSSSAMIAAIFAPSRLSSFFPAFEVGGDRINFGRLLLFLFLIGKKIVAHPARAFRIQPAAAHHGRGGIIYRTGFARHCGGKYAVDRIEDGVGGAEIAVQLERAPVRLELFVFIGEKRRTAAAETVYRLLCVADHEHVFAGNEGKYLFLRGVYVLIFVHKDVRIPAAHLFPHIGDAQKGEALVFEVGKIEHARPPFQPGILLVEGEDQAGKRPRNLARGVKSLFERGLVFQPFERLSDIVGVLFERSHPPVQRERVFPPRRL